MFSSDRSFQDLVSGSHGNFHSVESFMDLEMIVDDIRNDICKQSGVLSMYQRRYPTTIPPSPPKLRIIFTFSSFFDKSDLEDFEAVLTNLVNDVQYYNSISEDEYSEVILDATVSVIGNGLNIIDAPADLFSMDFVTDVMLVEETDRQTIINFKKCS